MNNEFINEYIALKRNNDLASKIIATKLANQEIDETTFNNASNNINNNLINFCKTHLKSCNEFLKEKINLEISIYIKINEFDINLKEIETVAVKTSNEFEQDIKNFYYQINNRFINDKEKNDLIIVFEMIKNYYGEAINKAPKRQDYTRIKSEVELANKKQIKFQETKDKDKQTSIKKVSIFYKLLPLIIFSVVILIFYAIYFFNNK